MARTIVRLTTLYMVWQVADTKRLLLKLMWSELHRRTVRSEGSITRNPTVS